MRSFAMMLIGASSALCLCGCATETATEGTAHVSGSTNIPSCVTGPLSLSASEKKKIGLTEATVEERNLPMQLDLAAVVQENSNMSTPVRSLVPGKLEQVNVSVGDTVIKGEDLAKLRSEEVGSIQSTFLEKYLEMEEDRQQALLEADISEKQYNRKRVLVDEKIGARAELEAAESDLAKARASIKSLERKQQSLITATREELKIYGITGDAIEKLIETRQIHHSFIIDSPRTGFVAKRDCDNGQNIDSSRDLFVITDLSQVWMVAQVFEKDVSMVKMGIPALARVGSFPNDEFCGKVDYISANIDPDTRTLAIRATVDNKHGKLKPQMFGKLTLTVGKVDTLCVPCDAVQKIGETYVAYVVKGPDLYEERKLSVGAETEGYTQVKSGLNKGEKVVVKGSLQLLGQALKKLSE